MASLLARATRSELFCFDVNRLFDFVEAALLQAAVARDMGSDLEFLAVGVGLNAGVEARGGSAELNVKGAREEESAAERESNPGRSDAGAK